MVHARCAFGYQFTRAPVVYTWCIGAFTFYYSLDFTHAHVCVCCPRVYVCRFVTLPVDFAVILVTLQFARTLFTFCVGLPAFTLLIPPGCRCARYTVSGCVQLHYSRTRLIRLRLPFTVLDFARLPRVCVCRFALRWMRYVLRLLVDSQLHVLDFMRLRSLRTRFTRSRTRYIHAPFITVAVTVATLPFAHWILFCSCWICVRYVYGSVCGYVRSFLIHHFFFFAFILLPVR